MAVLPGLFLLPSLRSGKERILVIPGYLSPCIRELKYYKALILSKDNDRAAFLPQAFFLEISELCAVFTLNPWQRGTVAK